MGNRRNIRKDYLILPILVLRLATGCSVKEDRSPCPCLLRLHLEEEIKDSICVRILRDNVENAPRVLPTEAFVPFLETEVRRGVNRITACRRGETSFSIHPGNQADSLYAYAESLDCTGEEADATIVLRKQFATLHIRIEGGITAEALVVKGRIAGLDPERLEPVEGEFSFTPSPLPDGSFLCRLPRQKDNSLSMEMAVTGSGRGPESFPLGDYIWSSGYDWNDEDLKDIFIRMNPAKAEMSVSTQNWKEEDCYDTEL